MGDANELILQNFRCFRGEQRGRLRPITLLVGENSTGKSSFMAGYMVIDQCFRENRINDEPEFNRDPFELGSFKDIAYTANKTGSEATEFKIGIGFDENLPSEHGNPEINIYFNRKGKLPHICNLSYRFSETEFIDFERTQDGIKVTVPDFSTVLRLRLPSADSLIKRAIDEIFLLNQDSPQYRKSLTAMDLIGLRASSSTKMTDESIELLYSYLARLVEKYLKCAANETSLDPQGLELMTPNIHKSIPMAPIRSKPKRSYDQIRERFSPEGDDTPMLIMHLSETNKQYWNKFRQSLIKFGKASELFSDIRVRSDESGGISSFEIQVKVRSGKFINIMDVGYGVSQCLPVIINVLYHCFNGSTGTSMFLLQQPEVHMHPRSQAELSDFVCNAYKVSGNRFLIETHSDFIIDRLRLLVRQGVINATDVSIIYFEPNGSSVKLHNLELDEDGNLSNCPKSYRDFFWKETNKLIGIED